jgi:hypothetical protein
VRARRGRQHAMDLVHEDEPEGAGPDPGQPRLPGIPADGDLQRVEVLGARDRGRCGAGLARVSADALLPVKSPGSATVPALALVHAPVRAAPNNHHHRLPSRAGERALSV